MSDLEKRPKLQAYVSQALYDRFVVWYRRRGFKQDAPAIRFAVETAIESEAAITTDERAVVEAYRRSSTLKRKSILVLLSE